jgi:hypothetical protein
MSMKKKALRFVAATVALAAFASLASSCEDDVEVDCSKGKACEDSFLLSIIPGAQGFEIGTYHFAITAYDVTFTTDCAVTGSVDQTACEPLQPAESDAEIPSFDVVRDANDVITSFNVGYVSAPPTVQVRVEFGDMQLTDTTYTDADYEEVRFSEVCPVLCVQGEAELTVIP